jgi:hypothetical protein
MDVNVKKKDVWNLVKQVFPDYSGRKFRVKFSDEITFMDTNWSGGTKTYYGAIGNNGANVYNAPAPWINPVEGVTLKMRPDVIIVKRSYFCGHDLGITIVLHPDASPKWLAEYKK